MVACGDASECADKPCQSATCPDAVCVYDNLTDDTPCNEGAGKCADGVCVAADLGEDCETPDECTGPYCEDGVCCATECGDCGDCAAGEGMCEPKAVGAMDGACDACDGLGNCPSGQVQWAESSDGSAGQLAKSVAFDSQGNMVVGGYFQGILTLGSLDPLSAAGTDIFVAKIDAAGLPLWVKQFGGAGTQELARVAIDPADDSIVLTGRYSAPLDFGDGTGDLGGSGTSAYLAKLDENGAGVWSQSFDGGEASNEEDPRGLDIDSLGNVLLAGAFKSAAVDFSKGGGAAVQNSGSGYDLFVAKFNSGGEHQWSFADGVAGISDFLTALAVDTNNRVVVTGYTQSGVLNLGGGNIGSGFGSSVIVAVFDDEGEHAHSASYGGCSSSCVGPDTRADLGWDVTTDSDDNIIVAGQFSTDAINLGGSDIDGSDSADYDVFLAKFSPTLTHEWSFGWLADSANVDVAVAVDPIGNVVVSGHLVGEGVAFQDAGPLSSEGANDLLVAKLAGETGVPYFVRTFGSADNEEADEEADDVAADANGNIALVGNFDGAFSMDTESLATGSKAIFAAKLSP